MGCGPTSGGSTRYEQKNAVMSFAPQAMDSVYNTDCAL